MQSKTKIIVRKKFSRGEEFRHQGGMWKVAYADFITAMMAFFMLLWVLNSTPKQTLKGIAEFFSRSSKEEKAPVKKSNEEVAGLSNYEHKYFHNIISNIEKNPELEGFRENIAVDITEEGLRIQIMDSDQRPMFKPGTTIIQPYMEHILTAIAKIISSLPNYVSIVGHTGDIKGKSEVDLWELSIQRANITRKYFQSQEHAPNIISVTGKANKDPIDPLNPYSQKNIRLSIIVLNKKLIHKSQKPIPETGFFNISR